MDLESFRPPTHLTQYYRTGGWVDPTSGRDDLKQGKFLSLMAVKLLTPIKIMYNTSYCEQSQNIGT
jgi:hypothetical protein